VLLAKNYHNNNKITIIKGFGWWVSKLHEISGLCNLSLAHLATNYVQAYKAHSTNVLGWALVIQIRSSLFKNVQKHFREELIFFLFFPLTRIIFTDPIQKLI
jgi:hypothetical protein